MRTYQHVIDTKAIKATLNSMPNHWVLRDLSERDYGIDLMVEIFREVGNDDAGHVKYNNTGHVCYLQVKGIDKALHINQDGETISFAVEKNALLYMEKFATPFVLIRVSTIDNATYFIWIQRYILQILDFDEPNWREERQEHYSIRIPIKNKLPENSQKIELIASRIKYIEEHSEFYERYYLMKDAYDLMIHKDFSSEQYSSFIKELKRFRNLKTLLSRNNAQVAEEDIDTLINYIKGIEEGRNNPVSREDFPGPILFNLELLLTDNFMRMVAEEMIAENDGDTVY